MDSGKVQGAKNPFALNINMRPLYVIGLLSVLFVTPYMRGLFFQPEMLAVLIVIGVIFLICVCDQVLKKDLFLPRQPLDWAVLGLVLAYALSLINAVHIGSAVRELMEVTACAMVYVCAACFVRNEKNLDLLLNVCFASGLGVALIGILASVGVIHFPGAYEKGWIMSTLQYKNALAGYMVLINLLGLAIGVKQEKLWPKLIYAVGNYLFIIVILGTQSRGGWAIYPFAVGGFVALLPVIYRWRLAFHFLISLGCALVASRGFFEVMRAGEADKAGLYVLYGAVAALVVQAGYHYFAQWINREEIADSTRRLFAIGGISYFAIIGIFYIYTAAGNPQVSSALPVEMARRAETISSADPNFKTRLEYARDALKIIKDYPVTGAGGGGWNALYHQYQTELYWTTEVHNHFLQTWVEAGIIGFVSLIAIWVSFILIMIKFWRTEEKLGGFGLSLTAMAAGVLALGTHSIFDFDLSMPALTFLVFAFFGSARFLNLKTGKEINSAVQKTSLLRLTALVLINAVIGVSLIVASRNFYAAGTMGALGARAYVNKDFKTAGEYYAAARSLDPFTASFAADSALICAIQSIAEGDKAKRRQAVSLAREAARKEPYNSKVLALLVNIYLMLDEPEAAVKSADALLKSNPLLLSNYEVKAAVSVEAARQLLVRGMTEEARVVLKEVGELEEQMEENKFKPSVRFKLYVAQRDVLSGDFNAGREKLNSLLRTKGVENEAKIWLAVAASKIGDPVAAERLEEELDKDLKVFKIYQELREESLNWPIKKIIK